MSKHICCFNAEKHLIWRNKVRLIGTKGASDWECLVKIHAKLRESEL